MPSRREIALELRSILCDAAQLSVFPAAMGAVACGVALYHGHPDRAGVFAAVAVLGTAVLAVARRLALEDDVVREGAALGIAFAWLLIPLFGAVPLWLLAPETNSMSVFAAPTHAIFESMSSFTSTGLSVAPSQADLPPSVQLWRSMAQWVGGMGMVMFGLLVIRASGGLRALATEEVVEDEIPEHVNRSATTILAIYAALTLATVAGFWSLGMSGWESVNHALTAVSTGGMTVTEGSFRGYSSGLKLVAMGAMMSGALSFGTYLRGLRRRSLRELTQSTQTRALVGVWCGGGLLLWGVARSRQLESSAVDLAFEWTSAVSTTGYSSHDLGGWPLSLLLLIVVMMIIGCAAESTGGGIKIARLVWITKRIFMRVGKLAALVPRSEEERTYHFDGEPVSPTEARHRFAEAGVLASLWLVTLALGILGLVLLEPEASMYQVVFDATSALGGVGLSTGFVSVNLHPGSKLLLTLLMWLGRLEIVTVLSLLAAPQPSPGLDGEGTRRRDRRWRGPSTAEILRLGWGSWYAPRCRESRGARRTFAGLRPPRAVGARGTSLAGLAETHMTLLSTPAALRPADSEAPSDSEAPPPASSHTRARAPESVTIERARPRDGLDCWRLRTTGALSPYDLIAMLKRPGAIAYLARDADGAPRGFAVALELGDHVTLVDATAANTRVLVRLLGAVVRDVRQSGFDWVEPSPFCATPTQELLYSLANSGLRSADDRAPLEMMAG